MVLLVNILVMLLIIGRLGFDLGKLLDRDLLSIFVYEIYYSIVRFHLQLLFLLLILIIEDYLFSIIAV